MKTSFSIGALILALLLNGAFAQEPTSSELPSGPLIVTKMPEFAQWTVDYTYSNAPKAGQPSVLDHYKEEAQNDPTLAKEMQSPQYVYSLENIRPLHVLVTTTGDVVHEETTFELDHNGEAWSNSQFRVEKRPNLSVLVATDNLELGESPFPDFDWISKKNFVGIEEHSGIKCMAFKQDRYNLYHEFIGTAHAYVDVETRYPVGYQFIYETREYKFLPPPTTKLTMPAEFVAAGEAMIAKIQAGTPHLAHP